MGDYDFLDKIELDSKSLVKAIRFSKDEVFLLKFIQYKRRKFSDYIKELIYRDLEKSIAVKHGLTEEEVLKIVNKVINNKK